MPIQLEILKSRPFAGSALYSSGCVARSQVLYGTVVGNVTDLSNRSIPNAQVVVTNKLTDVSTTVTSNAAGDYEGPQSGAWNIPGPTFRSCFASIAIENLEVKANVTARADEHLNLSSCAADGRSQCDRGGAADRQRYDPRRDQRKGISECPNWRIQQLSEPSQPAPGSNAVQVSELGDGYSLTFADDQY